MNMYTLNEIDRIVERSVLNMNIEREPESLYEPIEYMFGIGGKRIRPKLCLTTYSLFKDIIDTDVIFPALSLEVFHEFTLIHDDIMDKADTRRNQLTVHKKFGQNIAILSGDVMSILAYRYLAMCQHEALPLVLELFTETASRVCEGQQYDMDFENLPYITQDDYLKMIGLKTAVLIACSAQMGALLAQAPDEICKALYDFGYKLGMAFQITDDYLDTFGNEQFFGKKIGGDIVNNKKSWLLVECLKRAVNEERASSLEQILAMGEDRQQEKIAAMQDLYTELGVKDAAKEAILDYHKQALSAIENVGLSQEQIALLSEFSEQIIHREN